jgi:hypothetical protein
MPSVTQEGENKEYRMIGTRVVRTAAALNVAGIGFFLGTSGAQAFSASFSWCAGSPRFELTDVPAGTAKLQFHMTDRNVPSFHHGGGTIAYGGQSSVPCGAFSAGFIRPSPSGQVHTYEFTIKAMTATGAVLAQTTAQRKYPE